MSRRSRFVWHWIVSFVVLFAGLNTVATKADDSKRPNVIFIFTDDHAAHAMSCYGSKINQTDRKSTRLNSSHG